MAGRLRCGRNTKPPLAVIKNPLRKALLPRFDAVGQTAETNGVVKKLLMPG